MFLGLIYARGGLVLLHPPLLSTLADSFILFHMCNLHASAEVLYMQTALVVHESYRPQLQAAQVLT